MHELVESLPGVVHLELSHFPDPQEYYRGEATELFNSSTLTAHDVTFYCDHWANMFCVRGALRGLHGGALKKLLSVITQESQVLATVVDCRPGSPTFGNYAQYMLDYSHQLYVPMGCANSALTLSETAYYQMAFDTPDGGPWNANQDEIRLSPLDPELAIPWPLTDVTVHPRDLAAELFSVYAASALAAKFRYHSPK